MTTTKMSKEQYFFLITKFPSLKRLIQECYITQQVDHLYDLLFGLEFEDVRHETR